MIIIYLSSYFSFFHYQHPKMNQNLPYSPLLNLFILFFLLTRKAISIDPKYLACNPSNCGDGQNITFPFYIQDQQESFCGYPGFSLSCNNSRPIIKLQGLDYIIHHISYKTQTLRISNTAVFDTTRTCTPPFGNLTLPEDRFRLASNQTGVFLFYKCNKTLLGNRNSELVNYEVECLIGSEDGPTLKLAENDRMVGNASEACDEGVRVHVDGDGDVSDGVGKMLERGFVVDWIASNCSMCEDSGGKCGFDNKTYHFKCYCTDRPHAWDCNPETNRRGLKLGLGLGGGIGLLALLSSLYIFRNRLKKRINSSSNFISSNSFSNMSSRSDVEDGGVYFGIPLFSYTELEKATSSFDRKKELGDGGFGTVYHGKLKDGREVAVKRLYEHNYRRVEQFMNEIEILTRLRHKNLVTLYGCTSRRSRELLLVYEYIPNGTVADHLHGDRAKSSPLTWPNRMSIAIETATALAYLHASDIIHRDVKTNNILLDNNFCVKVADFGLSRLFPTDVTHVSTAPQGTPGYVDPEYHQCYQLTDKSDVYSFGVVLVELITSMPAVDISRHRHEINLANLAVNKIQKCEFDELIDPSFGYKSDEEVKRMTILVAELAFRCLQQDKELRPSMDEVLEELQQIEHKDNPEEVRDGNNETPAHMLSQHSPTCCDEASLLKEMKMPPPSPNTVTAPWASTSSCSTTLNISS
ncbi:LEAF RUST 10 DISEASE-RESISTANCE LOCUS RECEPTOR-LIKE PROTEIN KINASE-like 1.2 isoform X1 [Mercurialis annua]|uniref:LEAF RUST 10 DISEASE-RESISTANCE LOCUS RECEPTOR-LIKE PROTEIN KINASE-like 1.2 isoform X1 n=1 Tax=Mercurialis annua TaxID=3986 RepID=UPI00215FB40C|nr:LEAF RUST 10 DISEASE-RESISTANCE LOCUS RECEPTOR-LIKE PROTEIN KINASE-like 1.2 isoform X1 [Mercurialis annua]